MLKRKNKHRHSYRSQLTTIIHSQIHTPPRINPLWTNSYHHTCKYLQPHHHCFCGHSLSHHRHTPNTIGRCTADRCNCLKFYFVPDLNLKCLCKHAPYRHDMEGKKCSQCTNCIGFITDWLCECGYRFEQHSTRVQIEKEGQNGGYSMGKGRVSGKGAKLNGSVSLPRLGNKLNVGYPNRDEIKESVNVSWVGAKAGNLVVQHSGIYQSGEQDEHGAELKCKLRQANLRYFAKFKGLATIRAETVHNQQNSHETNALDLYIQPHNFRSFALSKHIAHLLSHRQ